MSPILACVEWFRIYQSNCQNLVFNLSGGAIFTVVVIPHKKRLMRWVAEWLKQFSSGNWSFKLLMGDLRGLTSQFTSPSFGRDVNLGVPCLDAACTVGLNQLSVAKNPDKPTKKNRKTKRSRVFTVAMDLFCFYRERLLPKKYAFFAICRSGKHQSFC